ncbi:acetyl-CoA carboxylase biotin carboxylase subunit family protein [Streptomyces sp. NPDC008343]|uniref:ATP-grasp domain-containing protein n=1 Tax=Streptomyces sp. NPDC008343 TaxID=3364828 RepID=UPI0036EAC73A
MQAVLFVYTKGGPPLDYVVPRMAAHAQVHLLALTEIPYKGAAAWQSFLASVRHVTVEYETDLADLIAHRATEVRAEAVLTLSESAVVAVAEACTVLGLRGAGDNAVRASDRRLMRAAWLEAGIPMPRFATVRSEAEAHAAAFRLRPPLLLKSAWSAGSITHQIIHHPDEAAGAWDAAMGSLRGSALTEFVGLDVPAAVDGFVLEEIVTGSAADWYTDPDAWGDYVSVEGIVADGEYHPLCVAGKLPTIFPFTERASIVPAALPEEHQRRIEALSKAAVDGLGLSTCATYTEIKLGADGAMWVIETAARVGGAMTARQIELAFGIDMIGMLTRELLGRPVSYPPSMPTQSRTASASLLVHAVHGDGTPWTEQRTWNSDDRVWAGLLTDDSRIDVVPEASVPDGDPVPTYDPAGGSTSMAALCLVTGPTPVAVNRDCRRITDLLYQRLADLKPTVWRAHGDDDR